VDGEVWVQEGTYNELINLRPFAHLYGGFVGTETLRDQRNWKDHSTILDGQAAGSVVTCNQIYGYGVCGIDGFTIRKGTGTRSNGSFYGGGFTAIIFSDHRQQHDPRKQCR